MRLAALSLLLSAAVLAAVAASSSARRTTGGAPSAAARWIAYSGPHYDSWDVFVVRLNGTGRRNLTHDPDCDEVSPAFSPDGEQVAFACQALLHRSDSGVFSIGLDGVGLRRLSPGAGGEPAWSPDGTTVAYLDAGGISSVERDGADVRRIASVTGGEAAVAGAPKWSPDGTKIAFVTGRGTRRVFIQSEGAWTDLPAFTELWVVNSDGSGLRKLTGRTRDCCPAWLPDSSRIAFAREVGKSSELRVVDLNGTDDGVLAARAWVPAGSPDGRQIAFLRAVERDYYYPDVHGALYVVGADGRGLHRLAAPTARDPVWSTDGRVLAFNTSELDGPLSLVITRPDGTGKRTWGGNDIGGISIGPLR